MMYQSRMLVTQNHHLLPPRKRPSQAIVPPVAPPLEMMQRIMDNRMTGMDKAGNTVQRYVEYVGPTTLSNKIAIAACADPHILSAMETAGEKFDNTPDERGTTPAMLFAQRALTANVIERSVVLGAHYDLDARDVGTVSLKDHAHRNDKRNGRKHPLIQIAVKIAAMQCEAAMAAPPRRRHNRAVARQGQLPLV